MKGASGKAFKIQGREFWRDLQEDSGTAETAPENKIMN
jgi:hypothetical protein